MSNKPVIEGDIQEVERRCAELSTAPLRVGTIIETEHILLYMLDDMSDVAQNDGMGLYHCEALGWWFVVRLVDKEVVLISSEGKLCKRAMRLDRK
jgi:hypothetical protein